MKPIKALLAVGCAMSLLAGLVLAADTPTEKPAKKLTCCQQAAANGKDCTHRCCVAAHKDAKSCEKCNPNKEDAKFLKVDTKRAAKAKEQP